MLPALKVVIEIQELDMQMIQLMRLKTDRQRELGNINNVKEDLNRQLLIKEDVIIDLKKDSRLLEGELTEIQDRIKKLDQQQASIKKVEEFNALSHEMSQADRERVQKEQRISDLIDQLAAEEDAHKEIQETLNSTLESSKVLEEEIQNAIVQINKEGKVLLDSRSSLVEKAEKDVFKVYERLLKNKKDRVVVPVENRCCSGCHIMLTAQDENMVRKGERLVFCEHCSRIHYWPESEVFEGEAEAPVRQRRRRSSKVQF